MAEGAAGRLRIVALHHPPADGRGRLAQGARRPRRSCARCCGAPAPSWCCTATRATPASTRCRVRSEPIPCLCVPSSSALPSAVGRGRALASPALAGDAPSGSSRSRCAAGRPEQQAFVAGAPLHALPAARRGVAAEAAIGRLSGSGPESGPRRRPTMANATEIEVRRSRHPHRPDRSLDRAAAAQAADASARWCWSAASRCRRSPRSAPQAYAELRGVVRQVERCCAASSPTSGSTT